MLFKTLLFCLNIQRDRVSYKFKKSRYLKRFNWTFIPFGFLYNFAYLMNVFNFEENEINVFAEKKMDIIHYEPVRT